ncbi:hypothetical protein O6H91_02G058700 [Diphasiastrum complanatum]|uniref:Uncharacterized protein n=1 Tax=Diphasiastrum complanatum TaxID=34168 RepID=A0ACC2EFS7_DIPCM|nr:hypothetical protein O6H91_02G058700 [Diphasiastrum complanatum]
MSTVPMFSCEGVIKAAVQSSGLIPGLLDDVVLYEILPRLPWYIRPLLTALSKDWKSALQQPSLYSAQTHRLQQLHGLLLTHTALSPPLQPTDTESISPSSHFPLPTQLSSPKPVNDEIYPQEEPFNFKLGRTISMLDPNSNTWKELPPIPGRSFILYEQSGVASLAGKVFVIGGFDPATSRVSSEVYMLDLGSGFWQWKKLPALHCPRYAPKCTAAEGKVYVLAGYSSLDDSALSYVTSPEVYHIEEDRWSLLPRLPSEAEFSCRGVTPLFNQVFAYGRTFEDDNWDENPTKSARIYNSTTESWKALDFEYSSCCTVVGGYFHDFRAGILHRYNASTQSWTPLSGRLIVKGLNPGYAYFAKELLSVADKPELYALLHPGDGDAPSLWRGDLRHFGKVTWHEIICGLPICYDGSQIVYLN